VITLEISPDVVSPEAETVLDMKTQATDDNLEKTIIETAPSGEMVGWARQSQNPQHVVRFFQGKGGFCVVVSNEDIVYFGLPGSRIILPETEVELPGDFIGGKPKGMIYPQSHQTRQTVTDQAMILGAGLATRFEPISGDTTGYPKPGVPLVGEDSVIVAIAKLLRQHGFSRILINTFYKPECLKEQLAALTDVEIVYIDESAPSGTAGGLGKALQQGLVDRSKPILITQGDAITDADLSFLMATHEARGAAVTIGGQIVQDEDVHKFGIIETDASGGDGQSGNITSFKEKPSLAEAGKSRFANSGFYILSPQIFDLFSACFEARQRENKLYDYAQDFFPAVLKANLDKLILEPTSQTSMGFWAQAVGGYWSDMGNPAQYIEAVRDAYANLLEIDLPTDVSDYYENQVIYWPGTKAISQQEGAQLSGNIVVARPH
jgi:NDP-sugar pyrophosphorylase family protein